jgi:hypothetical protein
MSRKELSKLLEVRLPENGPYFVAGARSFPGMSPRWNARAQRLFPDRQPLIKGLGLPHTGLGCGKAAPSLLWLAAQNLVARKRPAAILQQKHSFLTPNTKA